jgi:hypothetical protein
MVSRFNRLWPSSTFCIKLEVRIGFVKENELALTTRFTRFAMVSVSAHSNCPSRFDQFVLFEADCWHLFDWL